MSPATDREREPSAREVLDAVLIAQDQLASVQGEAMRPEDVRSAVSQGIHDAVSNPALWAAAVQAMQSHAKTEAGGWLIGMVKAALSKVFLFGAVVLAVYSIGGWSALASLFRSTHQP